VRHHPTERWTAAGAFLAGLAVLAGAFGAHLLRNTLSDTALASWETAARYQMYHGLALMVAGHRLARRPTPPLEKACWLFAAGVLLFSGSLYLLAFTGAGWLGAITPLGGIAFLAGWVCFAASALQREV
jgi:uncharacterized membrane protein YgdD (TMEM256/DUF423 family)